MCVEANKQIRTNIVIKDDILIVNIRITLCLFFFYVMVLGWKQML